MKLSPEGRRVLEYFEGRENEAYPDPASPLAVARRAGLPTAGLSGDPWTIGVGHTGADVFSGLTWTDDLIDSVEAADLKDSEDAAEFMIEHQPVTQGQFDGLVLICFNCGRHNIASSTLIRKFMRGDIAGAAAEFARWDKAGGKPMLGLRRRRAAERELFNGATAATAIKVAQMTT